MNKKLLAIAVGAALVAVATAATAGDEPTIYAKINVSVDVMDNGGPDDDDDGTFVSSNSSRLGIKGAVDLEGGLKAIYKYEMSTNYSSAGAVNGDRNAYLGLKGGFGQVIAGRHDMPFKTVGRKADLFGDSIGDTRQILRAKIDSNTAAVNVSGDDYADRHDNLLMYSNDFGAVDVNLAYGVEEGGKDTSDMGLSVGFKQDALTVMFAYENHGKGNLNGDTDSTGMMLTGAYKVDNMTFLAGYADMSDVDGNKGDAGQITGYTLGGKMKSGMNTFKLQYTAGESDESKTAASLVAVGVDHDFTKNTQLFAVYATIMNDDNVGAGFSGGGHDGTVSAGIDGKDSTGFSVGMIHKF
jgi:predicted porin